MAVLEISHYETRSSILSKRHIVGDIRLSSGLLGFPVKVVAFDPHSVLHV